MMVTSKDGLTNKKDLTNKDIVDIYIRDGLIKRCIDCQFAKLEEWKKQYKDDMLQDLIGILYVYDFDKLNDAHINNHMNALITKIIINNIYSQTSMFYKKYLKFNIKTDDISNLIKQEDGEDKDI